jgi:hypothetical protein
MNCKHVLKLRDDYCSGEIDGVLKKMIEQHLRGCAECRKVVEAEIKVSTFLKNADISQSDISVANDLLKKLDDIDREIQMGPIALQSRLLKTRMKAIMIILLVVGVLLIGIVVTHFEPRPDYHTIGDISGPAYAWMGAPPVDDGMESRWRDPVLIGRDQELYENGDDPDDDKTDDEMDRVIHTLDFDGLNDNSPEEF